jgi:hypothetical protein
MSGIRVAFGVRSQIVVSHKEAILVGQACAGIQKMVFNEETRAAHIAGVTVEKGFIARP